MVVVSEAIEHITTGRHTILVCNIINFSNFLFMSCSLTGLSSSIGYTAPMIFSGAAPFSLYP